MKSSSDTSVLLLAMGARPASELLKLALRHAWSIRETVSATAAFEEILRRRPIVTLLQVLARPDDAVELIRFVRAGSATVLLIAVALRHSEDTELAVRAAGIDCYIAGPENTVLIEQAVAELQEQRSRADARARSRRPASRPKYRRSLSHSLLLPTDMGGGYCQPAAHLLGSGERVHKSYSETGLRTEAPVFPVQRELKHG